MAQQQSGHAAGNPPAQQEHDAPASGKPEDVCPNSQGTGGSRSQVSVQPENSGQNDAHARCTLCGYKMTAGRVPVWQRRGHMLFSLLLVWWATMPAVAHGMRDMSLAFTNHDRHDVDPDQLTDFRQVPYESLMIDMAHFSETGVEHFSEILFDVKRYQLIVGARDTLLRLSLDGLTKLEMTEWAAKDNTIMLCKAKGQTDEYCRNFIKVLVELNDKIFVCGTHAFAPKCSWREIQDISKVIKDIDGKARCPYSPLANVTALMTQDGDYFIGSATDFVSSDYAIYRMSGESVNANVLRTVHYNSLWLAQPEFVASFETEDHVYFMFREAAIEYMNCGKTLYSRIARVCKKDKGGSSLMLKENWSTFQKARLNCSVAGDYPFYYDELQSAVYVAEEKMVYGVFTTGANAIPGSAVCTFNMTEIEKAFSGPFKHRSRPDSTWGPANADLSHYSCGQEPDSDSLLVSSKYQLMDRSVQGGSPLYREQLQRFQHLQVDRVQVKHLDAAGQPMHVIFVATERGVIRKLSHNAVTHETCLIEILHPFSTDKPNPIKNMKLLGHTSSLYLSTQDRLMRLSTSRCSRFKDRRQCINANDPYCGWDRTKNECTTAPNKNPRVASWLQNPATCPVLTDPVDGGWSDWGPWNQCSYSNPDPKVNSGGDYCLCRRRSCDSPAPAHGGAGCEGPSLVVTNCTQHGGWTEWSEWSGCSQSCGVGLKTRTRSCGNPEPAFGGHVCVGRDRLEEYCDDLPPCPGQHVASSLAVSKKSGYDDIYSNVQSAATWSDWSEWTDCSARCGLGFRSRARKCYGVGCLGCDRETEECENTACSDYLDITDWTPWINTTQDSGGWYEKRFTFTYRSPVGINKIGRVGEEERYCYGPERCTKVRNEVTTNLSPEDLSEWSSCTRECGGGKQFKVKLCRPGQADCSGQTIIEQECNTSPCPGTWSCWSDWGRCNREGKRTRSRQCVLPSDTSGSSFMGGGTVSVECDSRGLPIEEEDCHGNDRDAGGAMTTLAADGKYTSYTATGTTDGGRNRQPTVSSANCDSAKDEGISVNVMIGACVVGFMFGCATGALLVYYYIVRHRKQFVGGSSVAAAASGHNYISAKNQNLYVSLPMLDMKQKSVLGGSGSGDSDYGGANGTLRSNGTGTLRSKTGSSIYGGGVGGGKPGEYETATIKRSHSRRDSSLLSGGIRADMDSDQPFT